MTLCLDNVVKRFGPETAVDGVSLKLEPGKITAVVGPNGAGKSTLLRMACGLISPDSGSVLYDGIPVRKLGSRLYRRLSAVLEDSSLAYMSLRGWMNLEYQGTLYGLSRRQTMERASGMIDRLDLRRHMDKRVGDWSRGTQQKLALVTALLPEPRVLLLDESTLGLDVVSKRDFLSEVRRLADDGMAVLLTSHQSDVIGGYADDILLLRRGSAVWGGSYREFMRRYANGNSAPGTFEQVLLDLFDEYEGSAAK